MKKGRIRKMAAGIMCVMWLITCAGCGKTQENTGKSVDLSALKETMLQADTTLPKMNLSTSEDKNAELNFSALTDLEYSRVDQYFYAYAKEGTAQEIAVIALKDAGDAADFMEALQKHVDNRIGTLQEYSPEQVEMAQNAVITREGSYVTLIICEKSGLVQKAFKEAFEAE